MTTRALVLGGGGLAGIAWEMGILVGLADNGIELTDADLVVGTSAGSVVGAVLLNGSSLSELYAGQVEPGEGDEELGTEVDLMELATAFGEALSGVLTPEEARARVGAAALVATTVPEEVRRTVIASRLPVKDWPEQDLRITTAVAKTGEFVVFDKNSGVSLVDAVAASCAVPVVWPTLTIDGVKYMDGGIRSTTNADLAEGYDRVIVIAPYPPIPSPLGEGMEAEVAGLEKGGAKVLVISPDEVAQAAFGANPLDPSTRPQSALAGRDQGNALADMVRAIWLAA